MMHGRAAENLHVEVPHVHFAAACFPHQGKGFDEQAVEWLAAPHPIAQTQAGLAQVVVAELFHLGGQRIHQRYVTRAAG